MASKTITIAVLDESELKDGEMKQVDFGETEGGKVLLSKIGNDVHATSAFCTHYGAPLAKGVLVGSGRVTCPWHGACFNVCTGDIEDAPAPASLHKFQTSIKDGKIHVTADPSKTKSSNKSRSPAAFKAPSTRARVKEDGVVIVGGGAGGLATLIGLRECGYAGNITIVSEEPYAPIDRTKLSKALITDASKLEWYPRSEIEGTFGAVFKSATSVTAVDVKDKKVILSNGESLSYEKLVLSPGGKPRRLPIPGADLPNVLTLRSVDDAKKIDAALSEGAKGKNVVVVGSSFIGMELVVAINKPERELGSINVIGLTSVPFEPVLGKEVGGALKKFHESKGIKFHGSAKVNSITSDGVKFSAESSSGETTLPADVVIMATGVGPATEFLQGSGINLNDKDKSVEVDEYLLVKGVENVYAIGDIARFPSPTSSGSSHITRIEHWNVAQNHGRAVASHISGTSLKFDKTPVFWSAQGQQLRYVGHAEEYDEVYVKGDLGALKFIAYYIKGDEVLAVSSMQSDPVAMKCSELIRLKMMPSAKEIKGGLDPLSIDISSSASGIKR